MGDLVLCQLSLCMEHAVTVILCLFFLCSADSWCYMAAREPKCLPWVQCIVESICTRSGGSIGSHTHHCKVIQGPTWQLPQLCWWSFNPSTHHGQTDSSHHRWRGRESLRSGQTKCMNIWPCHLDAARSPADQVSKGCSRGVPWVLCRLGWRVMLRDTWPHAAGGGSSD